MELTEPPPTLSELIGSRVVDASGRSLGRLFDIQGRLGADGSIVVENLVAGRGGLWRRLKGSQSGGTVVAWDEVVGIAPGKIVVAGARTAGHSEN